MTNLVHHRANVNGIGLHYVLAGKGLVLKDGAAYPTVDDTIAPVVIGLHGWPQNHREFLPIVEALGSEYTFILPDLRGFADSDKPMAGYEPKTIAQDLIELLDQLNVSAFHIMSHDLGGPPSVALAYMAEDRAMSLATIETPYFGLNYEGFVDPRDAYWHLGMHMNMDVTHFLIQGREDEYIRRFFREFAYNPDAIPEAEVQWYARQMRRPGALRASLNHYGYIPQMAEQMAELSQKKLSVPVLAYGGRRSFQEHTFDSANAIAEHAEGGVIEECGHWVFEERPAFINAKLSDFWSRHSRPA